MTIVLLGIAVLLLLIAAVYWITPAGSLPVALPGHEDGSTTHHVKHGLAIAVLALAVLVGAWFTTAPDHRRSSSGPDVEQPQRD